MKAIRYPLAVFFAALLLVWTSTAALADESLAMGQEVVTVNVNSASAEELAEKLDGIGQARAEMIVRYREENGPFTSVEQLLAIKGVGTATLEKNRDKIQL